MVCFLGVPNWNGCHGTRRTTWNTYLDQRATSKWPEECVVGSSDGRLPENVVPSTQQQRLAARLDFIKRLHRSFIISLGVADNV